MDRPSNKPDNSPVTKDDQPNKGGIGESQASARHDEKNLPRGSEPETRGSSRGR